jgi:hypothetical protein
MPYRFNKPRRHRIPRARYRVQNWPEYDRALRQRGSLTVWVTPQALAAWQPPRTGRRGRPRDCSDVAIEAGHLLRLAFGRPWRQTEGLLRSLVGLLGWEVGVPDHTTFARRSPGLALATALARAQASGGPVDVVIDATGLKVRGAGEWQVEQHGACGRRGWRKLHLAVDPGSGEILACELTSNEEGDASQVGPLLAQIPGSIGAVIADGAYDGEPVYRAVAERQSDPPVAVVIPPRATAVPSPAGRHITESTRPAYRADPEQGTHRLAEGSRLWPTIARGNGGVPLQGYDRQQPSCPHPACSEGRGPGRLFGAQQDDPPRHADVPAHRLKRPPANALRPLSELCTKAPARG